MSPTSTSGARADYGNFWGADDLDFFSRYDGSLFSSPPLGAYRLGITDATRQPNGGATCTAGATELAELRRLEPDSSDVLLLDLYAQKVSDAVWRLDRAVGGGITEGVCQICRSSCKPAHPNYETVNQFLADAKERTKLARRV